MTVSDFVRVQGIGKTRVQLRGMKKEGIKKNWKEDEAGFRMVFDAEMKRQEEKDGKSEETNTEPEEDHEEVRLKLGELAGTVQGRG